MYADAGGSSFGGVEGGGGFGLNSFGGDVNAASGFNLVDGDGGGADFGEGGVAGDGGFGVRLTAFSGHISDGLAQGFAEEKAQPSAEEEKCKKDSARVLGTSSLSPLITSYLFVHLSLFLLLVFPSPSGP